MPRQKDLSDIPTAQRIFIKTAEWEMGATRTFYYTGYEKIERMSKKGNAYTQYLFYLLPINLDGTVGDEETLGVFASSAGIFKAAGIRDYQEVKITKVEVQGKNGGTFEDWEVVGVNNVLPEADRPAELDYPEMKQGGGNGGQATMFAGTAVNPNEPINLDDIPF